MGTMLLGSAIEHCSFDATRGQDFESLPVPSVLEVGLEVLDGSMLSPFCGNQWTMESLCMSSGRSRPTF